MADTPLVGLITIWYRASRYVDRFTADLRALRYARLLPVFVINDQPAEDLKTLKVRIPEAVVIEPRKNVGTAAAWNLAARYLLDVGADYIGIWNADLKLDPLSIKRLVAIMAGDHSIGACQPLILYSDGANEVHMYGGSVDLRSGVGHHDFNGIIDVCALPAARDAQYLDGGSMFIRAAVLREIGGFDEQLFMYWEDADLSRRIQKSGYRTVAVRDARAWHYHREHQGEHPSAHQMFYEVRNRFYFVRKHAGRNAWARLVGQSLPRLPRRVMWYYQVENAEVARAYLAGIVCGATQMMGKRGWVS